MLTKSKALLALAVSTVIGTCATASAAENLAFMREDGTGKHIWIIDGATGSEKPVTQGNLWHLYPDLSSDGSKLLYVEGKDHKSLQVVLKDMATGSVTALTPPGTYLHPNFSGDNRKIAFSGPLGPNGSERIGILDIAELGSGAVPKVVASAEKSYFPSLSSDGSFVVFQRSRADGTKDIVEVNLSTGALTQITDPSGKSMSPDLSFDDRFITYSSFRGGDWNIFVFDRMTGKETQVTTDRGDDMAPAFAPGGGVIFASNRAGRFALYEAAKWQTTSKTAERLAVSAEGADLYAPSLSGDLSFRQSTLAPMLAPPRSSFGAVEHQGRIYVAGGHKGHEHTYPPESFVASLEYFDIKTGKWHTAAPRQTPAHGFDIAAHGDYVYAFGGFAYSDEHSPAWRSLDVIERYSIKENKWETIGRMPTPRSSNIVATVGNKVWLIGGWDSTPQGRGDKEGRFLRTIDVFDLETEKITRSAHQLPDPLRRALTAVVRDGKIILLGGLGEGASHFELLDLVTEFDPGTGAWRELPRLPFATFAPAAGIIGGDFYVFGGMYKTGPRAYEYVNHIFSLAQGSSTWSHTGRFLRETKGFSMVVDLGLDRLGILGGHSYQDNTDAPVSTFEVFSK